jgi:transcriptional regulator with XRE-family HTH domain
MAFERDSLAEQTLRETLKSLRLAAGMRQGDLAVALGQPQSFVSKVESGERRLDILEFRRFCRALGVDASEVFASLDHKLAEPEG